MDLDSNPIFVYEGSGSPANPTHLTFSMTFNGLLSGSADALGTYVSEVTVRFYMQSNTTLQYIDMVTPFDLMLTGGPSDNQSNTIASQTVTGSFTYDSSGDTSFFASALAQSSATELGTSVATPLPAALPLFASGLGALGLLGWRRKRKAQAA